MTDPSDPNAARAPTPDPDALAPLDPAYMREMTEFGPVPLRYRHDGWVPDRQLAFIEALAECGCVDSAARAVGMSRNAAYALRRREDAKSFRLAWDAAMDIAVTQLGDSAMARAIHGVAVPVFYRGEQIGERRQFNERLTMFLLRYRDPQRYGKWLDGMNAQQHVDGPTAMLGYRIARMVRAAWRAFDAALRGEEPPIEREVTPRPRDDAQHRGNPY